MRKSMKVRERNELLNSKKEYQISNKESKEVLRHGET